ncbi:MAG: tol-pal system YbgF family protein [bacterium]
MKPFTELFLCLILLAVPIRERELQAGEEEWVGKPSNVLAFAEHLYQTGDFFRAISEYKRFVYLFPDEPRVLQTKFRIGACYQKSGYLENAIDSFEDILRENPSSEVSRSVKFEMGKCYFLGRDYDKATPIFEEVDTDRSLVMAGWSMLRRGKYSEASTLFARAQHARPDGYLSELSGTLSRESLGGENIPKKSPVLAASLSVPLPGGGRSYCGRLGDGIFSFLLVTASYVAAYHYYRHDEDIRALGFLGAGLLFHTGDVYGAAISARRFNALSEESFLKKIENGHNLGSILLD